MEDVIVVGAGPAGNHVALGLAERGYAVTVIDWRHNIGDKLCTGIVGRECLHRFPIDPPLVYREVRSGEMVAPSAPSVRFEAPTPQAYIIDRVGYVSSFARRAGAAGARYVLGQRVTQLDPRPDRVTVTTEEGQYEARAVVLATGFGSPLTRQLGLGSVPDYVVGVQATVATREIDEVRVYLGHDVAPGFFSWLVPTRPGEALAGLLARRQAPVHLASFVQRLWREGKITRVIKEAACWGIPLRPLKRTYQDRVLVVGDAAGQVKPTTGGGIYYSLLSSEIAVDVLAEALALDDLSAARLGQYQRRWKVLLSQELEVGYSARRLYEFLNDQQISSLVQQAGANGMRSYLASTADLSFDWHSRVITRIIGLPALEGVLRLINPLLARLTLQPDA